MAAPNYQILVNGVDLSTHLDQSGWNVQQNFGRQGDTAHIHLYDDYSTHLVSSVPTPTFVVKPLQSVVLKTTVHTNLDTTLFAGRVTTPNFASPGPTVNDWILDCVDYTSDTDNVIVSGDYNGWTADAIIKDLVRQANSQFVSRGGSALTTNNVSTGPVIQRVQVNYLTLSNAIVKVARLASQYVDYAWYIDYSRDVHFLTLQGATGSPIATFSDNTPSAQPTVTNGFFLQDNYAYVWDGTSMRNSMIVRGTTFQTSFHDVFVGNGSQTSWPLTYHVTATSSATLSVAGGGQTVEVLDNVNNTGAAATSTDQFIITMNKNGQWFLQVNPGFGKTPASGAKISLAYTYDAPILARADNTASQTQYTGTNGGIYQGAISDSTLVTVGAAVQRGEVELQSYQWVQERVTFTTVDNWPGHIFAGQTFTLQANRTPDSQNGYAMGLNGTFMVVSNSYGGSRGNYRGYTITGTRIQ
jgi:hypothetical protein